MRELVRVTLRGDVGVVTVTNPPVNALSSAVAQSLASAVQELDSSDLVQAIVVIGSGQTFIAGADIRELAAIAEDPSATLNLLPFLQTIEDSRKPVVMAIHGSALGGGLETAMCGHYRVVTPAAQVGMPEVNLGLIPGGAGTQRLPRLIGPRRAAEMCLSGKPISASAALEFGIADRIAEGDLLESAIEYARKVAPLAPSKTSARNARLDAAGAHGTEELLASVKQSGPKSGASVAVLEAILASTKLSFENGCKFESELFNERLHSDEARARIHLFFAERAAAKIPLSSGERKPYEIRKAGVIGAGTMGTGIAIALADAGIPVLLKEVTEAPLERGMAAIRSNYERAVAKGRLNKELSQARLSLIKPQLDFSGFAEIDLAIEAVYEDLAVKRKVMEELGRVAGPECLIATNTSSLDVDRIGAAANRSGTTVGLHFFSPANVMRLLEVIPGAATKPEVTAACMAIGKRLGKVAVLAGNSPGFIGNRVFRPYLRQARFLVEEGASVQDVNEALVDFGMGMGPLAVDDLIGIDVSRDIERQFQAFDPDGLRRSELLEVLYQRGEYGQKTGRGWSKYTENRNASPNPEINGLAESAAAKSGIIRRKVGGDEIVDRCICALINEGARVLAEGVARRASDVDVVFVQGYGFPSARGGPMFHAELVGLSKVLAKLRTFEERFGSGLWSPAPLLLKMEHSGKRFSQPGLGD